MPPRASSRGMVDRLYTINGLRESYRSGERLWGERQGESVTAIVGGISKLSWPPARYAGSLKAIEQWGAEHPRGQPQRQIASRMDRQQPTDILPRVSSSNTLFRSGTVSPVPPPPGRRRWFTPLRHLSTRVVTGGRCRPCGRPPPRASPAGRAGGSPPWGKGTGPGPTWARKLLKYQSWTSARGVAGSRRRIVSPA